MYPLSALYVPSTLYVPSAPGHQCFFLSLYIGLVRDAKEILLYRDKIHAKKIFIIKLYFHKWAERK